MARQKQTKKRRRRGGLLEKVCIALLLGALAWRLYGLRAQLSQAEAERDRRSVEVEELQEQNEALEEDLSGGVTPEKVEELARQELGLVRKDEYVFYAGG